MLNGSQHTSRAGGSQAGSAWKGGGSSVAASMAAPKTTRRTPAYRPVNMQNKLQKVRAMLQKEGISDQDMPTQEELLELTRF